jgi:protein-tyrosine-phosphatase
MNNKGLKKVLFVCGDNGILSQMAEAFARLHGTGRLEAFSAGLRPATLIDDNAAFLMQERGYDLSSHRPTSIIELPDITYDFFIALESGVETDRPQAKVRENWLVPDPDQFPAAQLAEIRDEIEMRVVDLITRLGP